MSTCAIVLGGEFPSSARVQKILLAADFIIAADYGAEYVLHCGRFPDLLLGDMDSLTPEVLQRCEAGGSQIHKVPCVKDETDGELAFLAARDRGYQHILLFSSGGGRVDHFLTNLFVACRFFAEGMGITIVEDAYTAYFSAGKLVLNGQKGDILSLIPMTPEVHGVTLAGCCYPLTDATLTQGFSLSICNEFMVKEVMVQQRDGILLLVHYSGIDGRNFYERTYG